LSQDACRAGLAGLDTDEVRLGVLRDRQATCSLKVSALLQAIRELDSSQVTLQAEAADLFNLLSKAGSIG
jgi:hypothetical protein